MEFAEKMCFWMLKISFDIAIRIMIFETTKKYVLFTLFFWFIALLTHIIAHTNFFSHGFFEEPNLYNVSETGWFVSPITHSLSSLAITASVLNFNLPLSFNKKWIIAFIVGVCSGLIWEEIKSRKFRKELLIIIQN